MHATSGKSKPMLKNYSGDACANAKCLTKNFVRQFPIDTYIVDFVCLELKLIIELDGGHHMEQIKYDQNRTEQLQKRGFNVIRFWNNDVLQDTILT